jgi:hypothetical protein
LGHAGEQQQSYPNQQQYLCVILSKVYLIQQGSTLKEQCNQIFCFRFKIIFPQALENNIKIISNFFENRGDIRKSRCTVPATLAAKFATSTVVDTGGK